MPREKAEIIIIYAKICSFWRENKFRAGGVLPLLIPQVIEKVMLKAALKSNLKEMKIFTMRNVDTSKIKSVCELKSVIRNQLSEDIEPCFDVGYIQGSNVIRVRSKEDLSEMWSEIKKSKNTCVWCDGLMEVSSKKSGRKRKTPISDGEDSDEGSSSKPKPKNKHADVDEKVQEMVDTLNGKHGRKYTFMQIRIWAELLVSGLYNNLDDPPYKNSMFARSGSGSKQNSPVSKGVQEMTSPVSTKVTPVTSPARMIESRSKLYKQLTELQNLKSVGVLDENEYKVEKQTIPYSREYKYPSITSTGANSST